MSFRFPPLTFSVFGLGAEWSDRGWVDELRLGWGPEGPGAAGYDQIEGVWLGHGDRRLPAPGSGWLLVGSFNLSRGGDIEGMARTDAMFKLTGCLAPSLDEDQDYTYSRRVYEFANEANSSTRWRQVSWTCDGNDVDARVFDWAGGWVGYVTAFHELPVVVVAANYPPENLSLSRVGPTNRYKFDPSAPFEWPTVIEESESAALGADPDVEFIWPRHADHDELLVPPLQLPPPPRPYVATSAGVRLVELVPFEDGISRGWRATTDDGRKLEIRFHHGILHVRRLPGPDEGEFHPSPTDPRRGVRVYQHTIDDDLFNEPLERPEPEDLTTDEMLEETGMILLPPTA